MSIVLNCVIFILLIVIFFLDNIYKKKIFMCCKDRYINIFKNKELFFMLKFRYGKFIVLVNLIIFYERFSVFYFMRELGYFLLN